jgi:hypothetical protein
MGAIVSHLPVDNLFMREFGKASCDSGLEENIYESRNRAGTNYPGLSGETDDANVSRSSISMV